MIFDSIPDDWRTELADAFAVLLGRSLSDYDPDAHYGAYFGGNFIAELGFHRDSAWLRPEVLSGREALSWDDLQLYYFDEVPLRFDASESTFEIDALDEFPSAFTEALMAAPNWGDSYCRQILGKDLARLLEQHEVDLSAPAFRENWYVCDARIASDGTLLDGMRVAVGIGDGPESLVSSAEEAEKEWEEKLAAVPRAELRAHLRLGCQDAWRGDGLSYFQRCDGVPGLPVRAGEACSLIAYWDETQNQRDVKVVQWQRV